MLKVIFSAVALAAIAAMPVSISTIMSSTAAEAHSGYHKRGKLKTYRARKKLRRHRASRPHFYFRRRRGAIFASEVDLSRPGGPERFFELIDEESAR